MQIKHRWKLLTAGFLFALMQTSGVWAEQEVKQTQHIVAIDPGHQGSWIDMSAQEAMAPGSSEMKAKATTGTVGKFSAVPEYQVNLDVSLVLKKVLKERGYQVIMTREDNNTAISNQERAVLANNSGAEIVVRIHANGDTDSSSEGALTIVPSSSNAYVANLAPESRRLSSCILNAYCAATGFKNLGLLESDTMTGINWSTIPVTILEMGFMTNEQDDTYLTNSANYEKMAKSIANGIDDYFAGDGSGSEKQAKTSAQTEIQTETQTQTEHSATAAASVPVTIQPQTETAAQTDTAVADSSGLELIDLLNTNYLQTLQAQGESWSVAILVPATGMIYDINGAERRQSASVMKLFIMGAVYEQMINNGIDPSEQYDQIYSMIANSDNEAANSLVEWLGDGDFTTGASVVNSFCSQHGYSATSLGRRFLAVNPTEDNYTSATDCNNFLLAVYSGQMVNADASAAMLEILKNQGTTTKIPAGVPSGIVTANKTGELTSDYNLGSAENDAAIVFGEKQTYILTVLSNQISSNETAASTIANISAAVYQYLNS